MPAPSLSQAPVRVRHLHHRAAAVLSHARPPTPTPWRPPRHRRSSSLPHRSGRGRVAPCWVPRAVAWAATGANAVAVSRPLRSTAGGSASCNFSVIHTRRHRIGEAREESSALARSCPSRSPGRRSHPTTVTGVSTGRVIPQVGSSNNNGIAAPCRGRRSRPVALRHRRIHRPGIEPSRRWTGLPSSVEPEPELRARADPAPRARQRGAR